MYIYPCTELCPQIPDRWHFVLATSCRKQDALDSPLVAILGLLRNDTHEDHFILIPAVLLCSFCYALQHAPESRSLV